MNRYAYCGLTLAADLPLPELSELPSVAPDSAPDLEIRIGPVPETLPEETRRTATFAHNGREALWWLEGIGRFHVGVGGRRITLEPAPDAAADSLRLMLLQPVFALASVLRGDWLLNAAAVARDGQVSAFIGPSASGKSTAAALLVQQGYTLVSDGLLRLTRDETGRFLAHPQAPWLQLWPGSRKRLELADSDHPPVRPGLALQRVPQPLSERPLPLARLGLLREQRGNDLEDFVPSRRPGARGFETLLQYTAGSTWLDDLAERRALFQWGAALTAQTRIERLEVPWGWGRLEALAEALLAWSRPHDGDGDATSLVPRGSEDG